jgi:hypothetical protein
MTLRRRILAGLVAGLSVPAVAYAARSGLTRYDREHGNVNLLSQRPATSTTTAAKGSQQSRAKSTSTASSAGAGRNGAMDKGHVRMTEG